MIIDRLACSNKYNFFQLVDKLTTDEDIQDVEFDLNDVSY
mgnify:CR=1 FL=1